MRTVKFILASIHRSRTSSIRRSLIPLSQQSPFSSIRRSLLASILATILALFTAISCSKSTPSTPQDFLTWRPWRLQQIDTLLLDANNQIARTSITPLPQDCQHLINVVYGTGTDRYIKGFIGCSRPLILKSRPYSDFSYYFDADTKTITNTLSGSPRTGPVLVLTDSVMTLTKDSLVIVNRPSGWDYPYGYYHNIQHYLLRKYYIH